MKINRQAQDLHSPGASVDWVLKQQVERDICLLYHQLADYSYIMGDLYYGSVFALPYWDYLDFPGLDTADSKFLRDGCLIMILAMAWDQIDGSGGYISPHIQVSREAVARVVPEDEDTAKLARVVLLALDAADQDGPETQNCRSYRLGFTGGTSAGTFAMLAKSSTATHISEDEQSFALWDPLSFTRSYRSS